VLDEEETGECATHDEYGAKFSDMAGVKQLVRMQHRRGSTHMLRSWLARHCDERDEMCNGSSHGTFEEHTSLGSTESRSHSLTSLPTMSAFPDVADLVAIHQKFWGKLDEAATLIKPPPGFGEQGTKLRILDVGLKFFPGENGNRILLRQEFIDLYKEVAESIQHLQSSQFCTVTGQPEIGLHQDILSLYVILYSHYIPGKTCFLFYVLLQRVLRGQATLLYVSESKSIGITQSGVEEFNPSVGFWPSIWRDHYKLEDPWAMCDYQFIPSTQDLDELCQHGFLVMCTTHELDMRVRGQLRISLVMKPWTWEEIEFSA
jgi:hypothetical protein